MRSTPAHFHQFPLLWLLLSAAVHGAYNFIVLGFSSTALVTVWRPQVPVTVTLVDATLSRIAGVPDAVNGCGSDMFQQTAVTAEATFEAGAGGVSPSVRVTHLVRARLETADVTVATVDSAGVVSAVAAGQTAVRVARPQQVAPLALAVRQQRPLSW